MNLIDKANEICMLWNDSFTVKMKSTRLILKELKRNVSYKR